MLCVARAQHVFAGRFWAAAAVLVALLIGLYYRLLGLEAQFLRAESGWLLQVAPVGWWELSRVALYFVFRAYNGHYTPIAMPLELVQARFFGSAEPFWFWRQILFAGTLVITAAAYGFHAARAGKVIVAVLAGGILALHPLLIDLVSWPFMDLQLLCCAFIFGAGIALVRLCETGQRRFAWWFLALAYASMNFSGVGFAFSAAALLTAAHLVLAGRRDLLLPVAVFSLLTILHAAMMTTGGTLPGSISAAVVAKFGVAYWSVISTGLQSALGDYNFAFPDAAAFYGYAGFGLLFCAIVAICAAVLLKSSTARFLPLIFPALASLGYAALIAYRPDHEWIGFYIGMRYLVFTCTMAVLLIGAALRFVPLHLVYFKASVILLLAAIIAGHLVFVDQRLYEIWPALFRSHAEAWRSVLAEASTAIAEHRPIPHRVDRHIDEFGFDAKRYEALLRRDLGISPDQPIVWTP